LIGSFCCGNVSVFRSIYFNQVLSSSEVIPGLRGKCKYFLNFMPGNQILNI
jgi:hypothetical protein